jgi:hypothetical protein
MTILDEIDNFLLEKNDKDEEITICLKCKWLFGSQRDTAECINIHAPYTGDYLFGKKDPTVINDVGHCKFYEIKTGDK